jgi:AbrB family looped-hinge helix DNA binding protein
MKTTISTKGQIVLPAELRIRDHLEAGQEFTIERIDSGEYLLKRSAPVANQGLVKLLLECPVKDWFTPADRTSSTDDVRVPDLG